MSRYSKWSGIALIAGGAITLLVNAGITPLLEPDAAYAVTAASTVFLWRQGLSALAAALLLFGSIGLYLRHADRSGRFSAAAFMLAFLGSALLLASEWCQVFFVRDLALRAPEALTSLEAADGMSLYDSGALIALVIFTLGWIAFSISMLRERMFTRRGPVLVIAGFFAIPVLSAALPGAWGAIIGNAVLGSGWIVLGHELRTSSSTGGAVGHELYGYFKSDGSFDYELYKRIQSEGNKEKIDEVWVLEENIEFLADYIKSTIGQPTFGICHGTRRGREQEWFRKYLKCDVIGTEISDTAERFPHTIQWDFHKVKDEWLNAADFIYSNSFDHSYDPEKCINAWMSCVKNGGVCIIEHTSGHERATRLDPFGAHISQMPYLILLWGKGAFSVREMLDAPSKPDAINYIRYIIIRKR